MSRSTETENQRLQELLTALVSAVSQQFFHILLLRRRDEAELAQKIAEIDDEDFKNAMHIIDLLVLRGVPVGIGQHTVAPALGTRSILQAELAMEDRLKEKIESLYVESPPAIAIVNRASGLRATYRRWLSAEIALRTEDASSKTMETDQPRLFVLLLRLMEQTLVHAFEHWHAGHRSEADTAWQFSGAAMLYLTALAPFVGSPAPARGGLSVSHPDRDRRYDRFAADLALVRECAMAASEAERTQRDGRFGRLCREISLDCGRLAETKSGDAINAGLGSSDTFRSFARARRRMES